MDADTQNGGVPRRTSEENRNILIIFLDEVLRLCDLMREVSREARSSFISLSYDSVCQEICITKEKAAQRIVVFLLEFYKNTVEDGNGIRVADFESKIVRTYDQNVTCANVEFEYFDEDDKAVIADVISQAKKTFWALEEQKTFEELLTTYKEALSECEYELLGKDKIFSLLNRYYKILEFILYRLELFRGEDVIRDILIPILNFGSDTRALKDREATDEQLTGDGIVGMHSPTVLAVFNTIYDCINYYLTLDNASDENWNDIYHEIFCAKLQQALRYYMVIDRNEILYSAAVPIYESREITSKIMVPLKKLEDYNSYQGIRELRLAEKIIYEVTREDREKGEPFHIAVLGDIDEQPFMKMCEYLMTVRRVDKKDIKNLHFHVYTYNHFQNKHCENESYSYEWKKYDNLLLKPEELREVISKNQVLFFLDNRQLYHPVDVEPYTNIDIFKQQFSFENYEEYYKKNECGRDLQIKCKFMELYQGLVAYCYKGTFGVLKKHAREDFIKFMQNEMKGQRGKTAYIYISDMRAFEELFCINKHFVRVEKYNEKQIGIIRFSDYQEKELETTYPSEAEEAYADKKVIVFNMWQFVKHILLNKCDKMIMQFEKDSIEYLLTDICIGLDYSNWQHEIKVLCHCNSEQVDKEKVLEYVENVIAPSFEAGKDMYKRYLKRAFISFLYGNTKSVEDLLFLHIYANYQDKIGKISFEKAAKDTSWIKDFDSNEYKYSYKRLFWEVIYQFDTKYSNELKQYKALVSVENSDEYQKENQDRSGVTKGFLQQIMDACVNLKYESSDLYKWCEIKIG